MCGIICAHSDWEKCESCSRHRQLGADAWHAPRTGEKKQDEKEEPKINREFRLTPVLSPQQCVKDGRSTWACDADDACVCNSAR